MSIAVVNVPVHDEDPSSETGVLYVPGSNGHVVQEAEPHGPVGAGMVPGWSAGHEGIPYVTLDDGVHAVFFISFAIEGNEQYRTVVDLVRERRTKPVFFSLLGRKRDTEACRQLLEENRIPFYLFPDMGVRVLSHMLRYARFSKTQTGCPNTGAHAPPARLA